MKIIHCDQNNQEAWDSFLDTHPASSFYHHYGWRKVINSCFGHRTYYLAATEGNNFLGVLPLVFINSHLFGKILCSMPFLNYGGICTSHQDAETELLQEAQQIVADNNIAYLELRNFKKLEHSLHTSDHKVSMTLELNDNPDVIWDNFKSKQRTTIRRAYKNRLTVRHGGMELLDTFYSVLAKSWRILGTPIYRKEFFSEILDTFSEMTRIFIVYKEDKPVTCAFNGYCNNTVEGMWLGSDPNYRHLQANYILYWEMIKHGCENGCKHFHFGRSSTDSGGELFKKKWNAEPRQLYWQYHLGTAKEMPQLNVQNPKFKLAIALWRQLPLEVTTRLGPFIARSIP